MNYKKYILSTLIIAILIYGIYRILPTKGTFNNLILSKYSNVKFESFELGAAGGIHICTNNINKINKIMTYFKDLQLVECKFNHLSYTTIWYASFNANDNLLFIWIKDNKFIQVNIQNSTVTYKATNHNIDINYIKKIISN